MRTFNRLHSYSTGEFFGTWMSYDGKFSIQKEIFSEDKYGLICNSNDFSENYVADYHNIDYDDRRYTTMRQCLETYYKIQNEL